MDSDATQSVAEELKATGSGDGGEHRQLTHRELAMRPEERTARATEDLAKAVRRTPSSLESFALSIGSTAAAIVLAGVVLIVIADAVNLVEPIDAWPLITLGVAIAAVAAVLFVAGLKQRAGALLRDAAAPWTSEQRFEAMEMQLGEIHKELRDSNRGGQS